MSSFKFIGVNDMGPESGATCPHCGADGRYVYEWEQDGKKYAAMAGCYKALTGKLDKGEDARYMEILAEKVAKSKPLNGWDKNIIRLQSFLKEGKYPESWVSQKIYEVLSQRKAFLAKKHY